MARDEFEDDPTALTDEQIEALRTERTTIYASDDGTEESHEAQARRIFRENAGVAATTLVNLAIHGVSERTRLDAAKYVTERVLGKIGDENGADDPLRSFMEDLAKKAESFANKGE